MERVEEFTREGRNFVYIDFSGYKQAEDFSMLISKSKLVISKYPGKSLYTITNITNVRIEPIIKDMMVEYLENNKPYVKYAVVIGMDGIKKMVANAIIKLSGRNNISFSLSKEQAIDFILQNNL